MIKKILNVFVIYTLTFNTFANDHFAKDRIKFIKNFLTQIEINDSRDTAHEAVHFINNELEKIKDLKSPYDNRSLDELSTVENYLINLKQVMAQQHTTSNGIWNSIWNWITESTPYIVIGIIFVGALFLGNSLLANTKQNKEIDQIKGPTTLFGHKNAVNSVAITANGSYIISGSADKTIKVWETQSEKNIATLTGHSEEVTSVAIYHDKTSVIINLFIVSASKDNTVKVWKLDISKPTSKPALLYTLNEHTETVNSVIIHPSGKYIVSSSEEGDLKLWPFHKTTKKKVKSLQTEIDRTTFARFLAIDPNGRHFTAIIDRLTPETVKSLPRFTSNIIPMMNFDYDNNNMFTFQTSSVLVNKSEYIINAWRPYYKVHKDKRYITAACSPDGKKVIFTEANNGNIHIFNKEGMEYKLYDNQEHSGNTVSALSWDPTGKYFVSGATDHAIKIWNFSSKKVIKTFFSHTHNVNSVAWSSNGQYIISGSSDHTIDVYKLNYKK